MFGFWKKPVAVAQDKPRRSVFSTHAIDRVEPRFALDEVLGNLKRAQPALAGTMDDSSDGYPAFKGFASAPTNMSDVLVMWYASQSFIGHQLCGILAQHWLINKACAMPGDDAIRRGYDVVSVDGDELAPADIKLIKQYDRSMGINICLREFIRKGRIFGIRIAMFKVESTDPEYYFKPFNIDGVTPKSYKGIVQVDPYWTAPMLDQASASVPDSLHFYEPTWWIINGVKVHRSHLIIFRHAEPVDVLKPQYLYGGVPLPQQIMERVYAAERTANEAPQLAMTKRTNVWLTDIEKVMANTTEAAQRLSDWAAFRDNYGIKLGDKEGDEFQQFDTSLADMDALIMTQYQLVAAQAGVPATKLIGTSPKGFNATGEYEESSYHEMLESIQAHDLTPLLERHHALVLKSFGSGDVETTITWRPLDTPTALELAQTNLAKAQTGAALVQSGAIDSEDERQRIATDKTSGYNELGLMELEAPGLPDAGEGDDPSDEGSAQDAEFNEGDHPRANNGQFGSGTISVMSAEKPKHSPEQLAKWAAEKNARESAQAKQNVAEHEAQRELNKKSVERIKTSAMGQSFNSEQLSAIESYVLSGDRKGADAEGRHQTVNSIEQELKKQKIEIEKVSESEGGSSKSLYVKVGNRLIRVSDHELPLTAQREDNRASGLTGRWDGEVITSDWRETTLPEFIAMIKSA